MGLQLGMSVSDGSTVGLQWVSYNNNIFVNSVQLLSIEQYNLSGIDTELSRDRLLP